MHFLLIDGYIDEPACLGVPPYVSPYARYLFGAIRLAVPEAVIDYQTIDQLRPLFKTPANFSETKKKYENLDCIILLSGVSVPGKYLGGTPIRFSEIRSLMGLFSHGLKIICGPSTVFGIGEEGGKPSIPVENIADAFDLIIRGDAEIALQNLLNDHPNLSGIDQANLQKYTNQKRTSMDSIGKVSIEGAALIDLHPNFRPQDGGNLIAEIETFRGCPRFKTGGCRFCVEPKKGPVQQRSIPDIVNEITVLYTRGVRHFRLGNQTDFYAFHHGDYEKPQYPRPNPEAIESLLKLIRLNCPKLKTLHIDNVNALNFALYPEEARRITQLIVEYCTPGNIAAIGVESIDPIVIEQNNLKATSDQILTTVAMINELGRAIGDNGMPKYLPGLNFIMGLPGETKSALDANYQLLETLLQKDLWVRRINLRKLMVSTPSAGENSPANRKLFKSLNKNEKYYFGWKDRIRDNIDFPMLQRIFPVGRVLTDVYAELNEGNGTYLRQVGTYPILCYVPKILPLHEFYRLVVVDQGHRSLSCLEYPIRPEELGRKEWESIHGIGEKRARAIIAAKPKTKEEWLAILPEDVLSDLFKLGLELKNSGI